METIHFNGYDYVLNYECSPQMLGDPPPLALKDLGDIRPRSRERMVQFIARILNQKYQSSCLGHGLSGMQESIRKYNSQPHVDLSPQFCYAMINGGRDQGATLDDALLKIDEGTVEQSLVPFDAIYPHMWPSNWRSWKRYKIKLHYRVRTWQELLTALDYEFGAVIGVLVGSNFTKVKPDGTAPPPAGRKGGHAMYVPPGGIIEVGGEPKLFVVNSWDRQFGIDGTVYLGQDYFNDWFDVIVCKSVSVEAFV